MTGQGNVCLSSAGISSPPKRAAKGGANSASCLMPTVHSFLFVENLYKSDQEEHLEVSCSLACSAALAIFLGPAGQQLGAGGVLSRVADLFCSLCITSGVFHAFPFHTVTLAPFPSTVPSPCLTWIPGSLCDFLSGTPASLSFLTSVYFCSFSGPQECLSCFWAQLCLFTALEIFINAMWSW